MFVTVRVKELKGIGEKTAKAYEKLNIHTVLDLLNHFPRDYERFAMPTPIGEVQEGELCTVEGMLVTSARLIPGNQKQLLVCQVKDPTGTMTLKWFHQPYLRSRLPMGTHLLFRGKAVRDGRGFAMVQPEIYTQAAYRPLMKSLRPVYALTEGLSRNAVAKAMRQALDTVEIPEALPQTIRRNYRLMKKSAVYEEIHFPKDEGLTKDAVRSFAFEEFFFFLLSLRRLKEIGRAESNAYPVYANELAERIRMELPYALTGAQEKVLSEIMEDLRGESPMQRLLQGDVGSGKTIVALLSLVACVENGYQGAIMVPTEVLAKQHYEEFQSILVPYGIRVGLLTGSGKASEKKTVCAALAAGELSIVIGTHALFQESVTFDRLGLVIVDEQHRFGVKQRERLMQKGGMPHLLLMSATPIPRTLAMMLYGDMDLSILDEMPKNRLPIKTCVVDTGYRGTAYRFLHEQLKQGRQAYVICPLIEDSEGAEGENVVDYGARLRNELPDYSVGILHGRLAPAEKNRIMEAFARGEISVLVSTTVIEVGINVPNATVMMIENAERFGLAALHQLRGRVGRGMWQSYCILVQGNAREESRERLKVLLTAKDGFQIAEEDLRLRGPGEFFGIRQSGDLNFLIADMIRDAETLREAKEAAEALTDEEYLKILRTSVAGEQTSVVY